MIVQHSLCIQLCIVKPLCELTPGKKPWAYGKMAIKPGNSMRINLLHTQGSVREHLCAQH